MIWVYGAAGLVAFIVVVTVVAAAVHSVRSKGAIQVDLDAPEFNGFEGKIHARLDSTEELVGFIDLWRRMIQEPEKAFGYPAQDATREQLDRRGLLP